MAEPDHSDKQPQDYDASIIYRDTERGDAEQSRSTGEGDRSRLRSEGNLFKAYWACVRIYT